MGSQPSLQD